MDNIVILVKPGTTSVRKNELERRFGVKCQVVDNFNLLKDVDDIYAEEWPLRRALIDGAANQELKQQMFYSSGVDLATHQLRNIKVVRNIVGNYALVKANIVSIRKAPAGRFGLRGSGDVINGVHVFNHIVSIDWVPEV